MKLTASTVSLLLSLLALAEPISATRYNGTPPPDFYLTLHDATSTVPPSPLSTPSTCYPLIAPYLRLPQPDPALLSPLSNYFKTCGSPSRSDPFSLDPRIPSNSDPSCPPYPDSNIYIYKTLCYFPTWLASPGGGNKNLLVPEWRAYVKKALEWYETTKAEGNMREGGKGSVRWLEIDCQEDWVGSWRGRGEGEVGWYDLEGLKGCVGGEEGAKEYEVISQMVTVTPQTGTVTAIGTATTTAVEAEKTEYGEVVEGGAVGGGAGMGMVVGCVVGAVMFLL